MCFKAREVSYLRIFIILYLIIYILVSITLLWLERNLSNTLKSYFGSKKRDLSDKSNDGDERKKAKESNLDLTLNQDDTDVFSEGIDSLRCASILYDRLKNLDKKVDEIHQLSTTMNAAQIKGTQHLKEVNDAITFINKKFEEVNDTVKFINKKFEEVNDAIKFINKKFEEFEADRRQKEQEIAELKSIINSLNVRLDKADRALDCQEQYSRRNCLLIHNIDEENQESTDEVVINILKKRNG